MLPAAAAADGERTASPLHPCHTGTPFYEEIGMPFYKVWYRNSPEPLEHSSASILHEDKILDLVLKKENIASTGPSLKDIIASNNLAPVRYTEDESEPFTIG
ncbi:MAG TPA: hypothetical protein VN089_11155 [Duganella sp.]|nr:hypothetical protein [Duganella sp.]